MNFSEAARLLDLGHTTVVAVDDTGAVTARGVAIGLEMVPMVTIASPDGTRVTVAADLVERA